MPELPYPILRIGIALAKPKDEEPLQYIKGQRYSNQTHVSKSYPLPGAATIAGTFTRYHGVLGPHYKHRKQIVPKPPKLKVVGQEQDIIEPKQLELKKKNIPWARLLARVFNIDVETCSKCGGKMKIIAAIEDPKVIRKILEHMGLATKPPPLYPARGPPKVQHQFEDEYFQQHFELNFDKFDESAD